MARRTALLLASIGAPIAIAACGSPDAQSLMGGSSGTSGATGAGGSQGGATAVSIGGDGGGTVLPDGAAAGPTPEQAFDQFEPELYAACGTCHGVMNSPTGAPPWFVGPNRYASVVAYPGIVVPDVQDSLFLTIGVTLQHAGGPGIENAPPQHLLDAVTAWLIQEANTLAAVPLPATAPFPVAAGLNTINISAGGVPGASMAFTVQIQGSILTFTDMTITAPAKSSLEIVHPIFNVVPKGGTPMPDVGDSFSNLDQLVPAGQTMPLGVGLFVLDVTASTGNPWVTGDELEIQFTTLTGVTATTDGGAEGGGGGCKSVATFTADAVPAIQANTCLNCHQGQNPAATGQLDMTQVGKDNTVACAQALTKVNLTDPSQSDIILAPTGGVPGHPFQGASPSFSTMMLEWISKE